MIAVRAAAVCTPAEPTTTLGVARAARRRGVDAWIVVPEIVSPAKLTRRSREGRVVVGSTRNVTAERLARRSRERA